MKKSLIVATAAALLAASAAVAGGPPPGKGKPESTGATCKPKVSVVLKGTLAATPGAAATSLSVNVTGGNKFGKAYAKTTQPLSIGVDPATVKVRRQGAKTLASLLQNDRVMVHARACKAELAATTLPALTAVRVVAHPPKAETTTTTTTSTTTITS